MIELKGVSQRYGHRRVLKGLDLIAASSEILCVLGPNGMGKSTLLGVMAGTLCIDEGEVRVEGRLRRRTVEDERWIRRRVVYLPADAWLPSMHSARDYVLGVADLYGVDLAQSMPHAEQLFDVFNIRKEADQPLSSLSTGQRKKVALCGTFITEARVLILDEPFSGGLDPAGIMALTRLLRSLADDGGCVVVASPEPRLVEEIADRIALLVDGAIVNCDTLDGLRQTAGLADASLADVLAAQLHPRTEEHVAAYLEARRDE